MILKVKNVKKENKNSFSLILEKPTGFSFYPGQFLDIELPVKDPLGKTRIFSIASSPSENFIMLTYQIGITPFKKELRQVKAEDLISSTHPAGTVVIDDSSPLVFIAGGIGIAPHRSMIKWAVDQKLDLPITLIYSNSDQDFIFKKELDLWQKQLPNFKIIYRNTTIEGRFTKDNFPIYDIPNTIYYLAGPPKMVDDFEKILLDLKVDQTSIRTDRFDGY